MRRYIRQSGGRGRGRNAVKSNFCGNRSAAAEDTVRMVHSEKSRTAAFGGMDNFFGHEEQQAQELRRAQSTVLHRKVARKQQRQARHQRQQEAQQQRQRLLRSWKEAEVVLKQRQQKQFKQFRDPQQERIQGMKHRSGRPAQRRQQQEPERCQEDEEEEAEDWKGQQVPGRKRIMIEGVATLAKTRKRNAEQQRQMLYDEAVTGTPATSRSAGWNGEASGTWGENMSNRKPTLRRKAIEICGGKDDARTNTSESSTAEEEKDEEKSEDSKRRKEFFGYPSCTDDYILPKKAKTSSKQQDVLINKKQTTLFCRAQEMRRHHLDDQREIRYLERQLGFNVPGISEDKKRKLVAKELAVLGLDHDFVDSLDTIMEPPQNALQQHQPPQDCRPEGKRDQRDAGQQQQGTGRERRSTKGTTAAEDFYRDSNEGNWKKTKDTMTRKPAASECSANSGLPPESYHVSKDVLHEQKARTVGHNIELRTTTEKKGKKKKQTIFRERLTGGDASPVMTERISPSTAVEEHVKQQARLCEPAAAFFTEAFSIRGKKGGKEEEVEETAGMPDKAAEKGNSRAASQVEQYRNPVDSVPQFSRETDCTPSGQRSSEGDCYTPPHIRRRLQQEERLKQCQQHADGGAGFVEADDTAKELQLRLRGLLNRASEGNVEMVLQQMVAAIKEAFSQLASFMEKDEGLVEQKKQQQLRRIHEHFMQCLCEGLSTLFIQNAVENKFSVTALIATQTALCCSLSAILGTQLLRCFLEELGRCFSRHYHTSLLLDTGTSRGKSEGNRNYRSSSAHASTSESVGDSRRLVAGDVQKEGDAVGKPVTRRRDQREFEEENQNAISTAALYARHVVAAMCFLFDYGALPATVYLQLLERLTVTQSPRDCAQGFHLSDRRRIRKIDDSTVYNSIGSMVYPESNVASSCAAGEVRRTQAVLSEFQVECLLLALRLGGRKLRCENPQLFKDAWIHLMAQAAPALQTEQIYAAAGHPARVTTKGREKRAPEDVRARGGDELRSESGHLEEQEKEMLERLKLRFQQRVAADRAAEHLQGVPEDMQGTTTTNGRLRFLVHELQELKNNKSNSSQLSSSAAAQASMRRWLHTSSTLRSALSLGASSNCCTALLEDLEGITWRAIEEGSVTLISINRLCSTKPPVTGTSAGGKTKQLSGTAVAMEWQSRTTAAAAAFGELESTDIAVMTATTASSNSRHDNVVSLAAKLKFHTENQKTIFSTLMSANNPNDAVERLVQMLRNAVSPKQQVVDVVAVVLHSCLQEKTFNPFYAIVLARLCGHCCCGSLLAPRQSPDEKSISTNRGTQKAHHNGQNFRGNCAAPVPSSASALPTFASARRQAAVEKLRTGCTCYTLPQKEAVKYKRVLQRGIAAQTSAAHVFSLRRLLHLAKLVAFLIRLGILELRLIRFLNFDEAAKEPDAGHMGLAGKFGRFLKELCVELLCDQSQASVPIPRTSSSYHAAAASVDAAHFSPLSFFFSVCNLPDVREALVSVLQEPVAAESSIAREKYGNNRGRRLSTAMMEKAIWLLKEAELEVGEHAAGGTSD